MKINKICKIGAVVIGLAVLTITSACGSGSEGGRKEQSSGYEMVNSENEMFLTVVVNASEAASVTMRKVEEGAEETMLLSMNGKNIYGALIEEKGHFEVAATCGGVTQKKVVHMDENKVYGIWFEFQ